MQPFSRETITDRRQPYVRWTAVIAGSLIALGTWMLLQFLFTGGALSSIDPDEVDNVGAFGIGTTVGSVLAPLLAMFAGGLIAGRIAGHYDRKVSAFHGALVWAISSLLGVMLLAKVADSMSDGIRAHSNMAPPPDGAAEFVDSSVESLNAKLEAQNAPTISKSELLDAARVSVNSGTTFDRNAFVARLDEKTALSRPEAEAVLTNLGDGANDVVMAANQLGQHRERALSAAEDAGNAMLATGFGLLLCLVAAAGGALLGSRLLNRRNRIDRDRVEPGTTTGVYGAHTTAQYPNVTPENR